MKADARREKVWTLWLNFFVYSMSYFMYYSLHPIYLTHDLFFEIYIVAYF